MTASIVTLNHVHLCVESKKCESDAMTETCLEFYFFFKKSKNSSSDETSIQGGELHARDLRNVRSHTVVFDRQLLIG